MASFILELLSNKLTPQALYTILATPGHTTFGRKGGLGEAFKHENIRPALIKEAFNFVMFPDVTVKSYTKLSELAEAYNPNNDDKEFSTEQTKIKKNINKYALILTLIAIQPSAPEQQVALEVLKKLFNNSFEDPKKKAFVKKHFNNSDKDAVLRKLDELTAPVLSQATTAQHDTTPATTVHQLNAPRDSPRSHSDHKHDQKYNDEAILTLEHLERIDTPNALRHSTAKLHVLQNSTTIPHPLYERTSSGCDSSETHMISIARQHHISHMDGSGSKDNSVLSNESEQHTPSATSDDEMNTVIHTPQQLATSPVHHKDSKERHIIKNRILYTVLMNGAKPEDLYKQLSIPGYSDASHLAGGLGHIFSTHTHPLITDAFNFKINADGATAVTIKNFDALYKLGQTYNPSNLKEKDDKIAKRYYKYAVVLALIVSKPQDIENNLNPDNNKYHEAVAELVVLLNQAIFTEYRENAKILGVLASRLLVTTGLSKKLRPHRALSGDSNVSPTTPPQTLLDLKNGGTPPGTNSRRLTARKNSPNINTRIATNPDIPHPTNSVPIQDTASTQPIRVEQITPGPVLTESQAYTRAISSPNTAATTTLVHFQLDQMEKHKIIEDHPDTVTNNLLNRMVMNRQNYFKELNDTESDMLNGFPKAIKENEENFFVGEVKKMRLVDLIYLLLYMHDVQKGAKQDLRFTWLRKERHFSFFETGNTAAWVKMCRTVKHEIMNQLAAALPKPVKAAFGPTPKITIAADKFQEMYDLMNKHSGRSYEQWGRTNSAVEFLQRFEPEAPRPQVRVR